MVRGERTGENGLGGGNMTIQPETSRLYLWFCFLFAVLHILSIFAEIQLDIPRMWRLGKGLKRVQLQSKR